MSDFSGRTGLIVGVANKRSLAWAIAQQADAAGARLVLTYQNDRLKENVDELAAQLKTPPILLPCDVSRDDDIAHSLRVAGRAVRRPRLRRPRRGLRAARVAVGAVPRDVARGVPHRARHQRVFARRDGARRGATAGPEGRRQHRDAVVPRLGPRLSQLQRDGCGQGGARVVGALPGVRSRRAEHPRQHDFGRPREDAGRLWRVGFPGILQVYRDRAALKRNIDGSDVAGAAMFLLSDWGRGVTGEVIYVDAGYRPMGM